LNRKSQAGNGKKDSDSRTLTMMTEKIATTDIDYVGRNSPGLAGKISPSGLLLSAEPTRRANSASFH
jgi:hypothetical protein